MLFCLFSIIKKIVFDARRKVQDVFNVFSDAAHLVFTRGISHVLCGKEKVVERKRICLSFSASIGALTNMASDR